MMVSQPFYIFRWERPSSQLAVPASNYNYEKDMFILVQKNLGVCEALVKESYIYSST